MRTVIKKSVAVILSLCMLFSVCVTGVSAASTDETLTVLYAEDSNNIKADIPVILVTGLQGEYYKGLSTETEEDDLRIWGPSTDVILDAVFSNIFPVLFHLIFNNYDKLAVLLGNVANEIFGDFSCDENGIPNPDTGKKEKSDYELKNGFGYENCYCFRYDWRLDMKTIAAELDEYIDFIMELTGSDKVALAAMSMGNSVLTTYLYEYYYIDENYSERNHIDSVVFIAGAMNGVACCEDPFSGNIKIDSSSLIRMLSEIMGNNEDTKGIYKFLEILYKIGAFEPVINYANNLTQELLAHGFNDVVCDNMATIPGFYALMSQERYAETREFIFDTAEKKEKYAQIIEKSDYYHDHVQANNTKVIASLLEDGINTAIIAEYGYTIIPLTSDNDRMADGTILTAAQSFGATCSEVDGTLGDNYKQAKECECGKNHVSADNQIDASTCAFPDITWFAKNLRHTNEDKYIAELVDLVVYSEEQVTVSSCEEYPQFLISIDGAELVPLTKANADK